MRRAIALGILALTAIVAVTPSASADVSYPANMVENGSFEPDKEGWQSTGVDNWGGHQDGAFNLNGDGQTHPSLTQSIAGLQAGKEYLLTARYKAGSISGKITDEAFAAAKQKPFLHIKCGGAQKFFYQVHDDREMNLLYFKFKAVNNDPLVLTGELEGNDINVIIDDVHLSPVLDEKVHLRAFPIVGAAGDNTNYFISVEEFNLQGWAKEYGTGAAALIVHHVGGTQVIIAYEDDNGDNLRFLSATDELDESGSHKVRYLAPLNQNEDIPDGAIFNGKDALCTEPLPENAKATFTNGFFSLESAKYPGRYLRHFQFKLVVNNDTPEEKRGPLDLYHRDATWTWTTAGGTIDTPPTPPADAVVYDINSGSFSFGYSTTKEPGFHQFQATDFPYPLDQKIKRLNRKAGDWFSFVQNTADNASDPSKTLKVHYPAKAEGSGILHPGQTKGDVAMARFTANSDDEYHFNITATVIAEQPTGVGVTIYVDNNPKERRHMTEHNAPEVFFWKQILTKGQTVDIGVDNGDGGNWTLDHVLITPTVWTKSPKTTTP